MDTLVKAVEHQLDRLFASDALDVSTDIDVMQNMLRADGLTDRDRRAHGKAHDHHSDHMHHLTANGHRRCAGHTFKLPDDEQLRHAEQRLQKVRKQIGQ